MRRLDRGKKLLTRLQSCALTTRYQFALHKVLEIDVDRSGEIDLEEFYQFFNIGAHLWRPLLCNHGRGWLGRVDFREFVVCVWNYCSFDVKGLIKFAFGMFDLDGSGVIEVHEMKELVAHVWGDHWESNVRVQRIIDNRVCQG